VSDAQDDQQQLPDDMPEQMRVRREKLQRMRDRGVDPYPVTFPRTTTVAELRAAYPDLAPDEHTGGRVGVTGRVMLSRAGGKLCFATVRDGTGEVQVMLSLDRLGEESLAAWKSDVDLGDHIGVEGEVISSRRGELSVLADRWAMVAKALRPLPDKHKGLTDPEARVRQRYVDLIVRPEARDVARIRSTVVRSVRDSLHARGFIARRLARCQVGPFRLEGLHRLISSTWARRDRQPGRRQQGGDPHSMPICCSLRLIA
jgi:lysyl-tRNA synthetase class 2